MAKKYYTISDGYYREEYPMDVNLNVEKFYSVQRLEQKTTLVDILGDNVAEYFMETILPTPVSSRESWQTEFLEEVQDLMVFCIAKGLEDFNSGNTNDKLVNGLNSKIEFYKKRVREYITESTELTAIQGDDSASGREPYQGLPTYFYR
jgi:hypothetical protein